MKPRLRRLAIAWALAPLFLTWIIGCSGRRSEPLRGAVVQSLKVLQILLRSLLRPSLASQSSSR